MEKGVKQGYLLLSIKEGSDKYIKVYNPYPLAWELGLGGSSSNMTLV